MRFLTATLLLTLSSSLTISALPTVITRTDDLISRDGLELSKRAPEMSAKEAEEDALAAQIEKDIAVEEWGHAKRATTSVSPANAALAKQIADSIAEEEAASFTKRSPAKKLSAAELAQADAEEEEDEEDFAKRAVAADEEDEEDEDEEDFAKRAVAADEEDEEDEDEEDFAKRAVAVSPANAALAKQIADAIAEEEAAAQTKRSPAKKLSAAELAQADAEEEEDDEDN